jgi:phage terminase Nu1 subunit (DNA packaging protein)
MATKYKPVRWTIAWAASEFNWDKDTLAKALKRGGVEGEDGTFSTNEILVACYGDIDHEKLRKVRAEADVLELTLAKERSKVLAADDVIRVWADIAVAIRQIIKGSNLSDSEKNECLRQIRELSIEDFTKEKVSE